MLLPLSSITPALSIGTQFGYSGSSAYEVKVPAALINYFSYDPGVSYKSVPKQQLRPNSTILWRTKSAQAVPYCTADRM